MRIKCLAIEHKLKIPEGLKRDLSISNRATLDTSGPLHKADMMLEFAYHIGDK